MVEIVWCRFQPIRGILSPWHSLQNEIQTPFFILEMKRSLLLALNGLICLASSQSSPISDVATD